MRSVRPAAATLLLLALATACGKMGPPVRTAQARPPAEAAKVIPGGEAAPAPADEEEEEKR